MTFCDQSTAIKKLILIHKNKTQCHDHILPNNKNNIYQSFTTSIESQNKFTSIDKVQTTKNVGLILRDQNTEEKNTQHKNIKTLLSCLLISILKVT